MQDNEKIMEKLEKLLRLAESPNVNEAYAAAKKAQELFVKYNISREDVNHARSSKRQVIQKSTGIVFTAMTNPWVINLASVIAQNHRCKAFRYRTPHARMMTVGIIGLEEDFEFCQRIFQYAYACVMERCKYIRKLGKGSCTTAQLRETANAYGAGFVVGLDAMYRQQREAHQEWGLILVTPTEVEEANRRLRGKPKSYGTTISQKHQAVYQLGIKDGLEFNPSKKLAQ